MWVSVAGTKRANATSSNCITQMAAQKIKNETKWWRENLLQDISSDTHETKLHYTTEKDGIFVVEAKCGANQLNGSIKKTNNIVKASRESQLDSNLHLSNISSEIDANDHNEHNNIQVMAWGL